MYLYQVIFILAGIPLVDYMGRRSITVLARHDIDITKDNENGGLSRQIVKSRCSMSSY